MKRIVSLKKIILILLMITVITIPSFITRAEKADNESYIDVGESITTGTAYNNNLISIKSGDTSIATATLDKTTGNMTIKAHKKGKTDITLRLGTESDYRDYIYTVNAIDVFNNVSFKYEYSKITVEYDSSALPAGCTPVFSQDGNTWTITSTFTRPLTNETPIIYKAYRVNGVVTGSIKVLKYDKKENSSESKVIKNLNLTIGEEYHVINDIKEKYRYYLINGRDNITFDESRMIIRATDTGNTTLEIEAETDPYFSPAGAKTTNATTYIYNISVKEKEEEQKEDYDTHSDTELPEDIDPPEGYEEKKNNTPTAPDKPKESKGTWKSDARGWWFELNDGTYPAWDWLYIDGYWYFFDRNGYMDSNAYRFGCWIRPDGTWDYDYCDGHWCSDSNGWWYEDNGWYPADQWLKIDGYWYYFKPNGYMASGEWIGNYYLTTNGSMATDCYIGSYWVGADGAWVQ